MLGRVNVFEPVCNWSNAPPCATLSPTTERTTHMSSMHEPTCGNRSLTSMPLCPYGRNAHGDFINPPIFPSANVSGRLKGSGFPSYLASEGLGSNVSTLEGPPCMNR